MTNKEAINILFNTIQLPATRGNGKSQARVLVLEAIEKAIEALEIADAAERKKGKWIVPHHDVVISGTCSCCGWEAILFETDVAGMPFCPNCGADMREETDDDKRNI